MDEEEFFSPDSAVARLDIEDRAQIQAAGQEWLQARLAAPSADLASLPFAAFVAGAAWAIQFRWE